MRVLNFGSLNIDYVYSVDHFVQKGETLASNALNIYTGGKGLNQSVALGRAGVKTYHAGAIGEDGQFLLDFLKKSGVDTTYVSKTDETELEMPLYRRIKPVIIVFFFLEVQIRQFQNIRLMQPFPALMKAIL